MAEKIIICLKVTPEMAESFQRLKELTTQIKGTPTTRTYVITRTAALGMHKYMSEELGIKNPKPEFQIKPRTKSFKRRKKAS